MGARECAQSSRPALAKDARGGQTYDQHKMICTCIDAR